MVGKGKAYREIVANPPDTRFDVDTHIYRPCPSAG